MFVCAGIKYAVGIKFSRTSDRRFVPRLMILAWGVADDRQPSRGVEVGVKRPRGEVPRDLQRAAAATAAVAAAAAV